MAHPLQIHVISHISSGCFFFCAEIGSQFEWFSRCQLLVLVVIFIMSHNDRVRDDWDLISVFSNSLRVNPHIHTYTHRHIHTHATVLCQLHPSEQMIAPPEWYSINHMDKVGVILLTTWCLWYLWKWSQFVRFLDFSLDLSEGYQSASKWSRRIVRLVGQNFVPVGI